MSNEIFLEANEILKFQLNRYPLLFIDTVSVEPMSKATSRKNFTYNEWFFPSHFEGDPSVPGFILLENLAQTFIMTFLVDGKYKGMPTAFVRADNVFFKRKVKPGNVIETIGVLEYFSRGIAKGSAVANHLDFHSGQKELVASAQLCIAIPEVINKLVPKLPS
jgi:3-hydroxyacyl-[acyl-carrier-protein] dehydratase